MSDLYETPLIPHDLWTKIVAETDHESDRSAAIVSGSLLELTIERCIIHRLLPMTKQEYSNLFKGSNPLATFSAKIRLGYLLGLYGPKTRDVIERIKNVRNEFAHQFDRNFGHPDIVNLCRLLPDYPAEELPKPMEFLPAEGEDIETRIEMRKKYYLAVWYLVRNIPRETRVITPPPSPKILL